MRQAIDLTPRVCREAMARRSRLRRWTTAYVVALCLLAGGWLWGRRVSWQSEDL